MAGFSGKGGYVEAGAARVAEVTKWSFKATSNNPAWASSDSDGYKKRVGGVKDGSGSIEAKVDRSSLFLADLDVGTELTLHLFPETHFNNATPPVEDSIQWEVPAIVDSYDVNVDIDGGEAVSVTIEFSTNGEWTSP